MQVENKRLIVLFGILFSVVFCLIYYVLFSFTLGKAGDGKRTLYMNQVGLYEKAASAVSYTHLDVYKRQIVNTSCMASPRLISLRSMWMYFFIKTSISS